MMAHRRLADKQALGNLSIRQPLTKQLDDLEALPHLTQDQELEETRLKKLKLRLKDQMEAILSQYRSQQVA